MYTFEDTEFEWKQNGKGNFVCLRDDSLEATVFANRIGMWQINRVLSIPECGLMWVPGSRLDQWALGDRPGIWGKGAQASAAMVAGQRAAFSSTTDPSRQKCKADQSSLPSK